MGTGPVIRHLLLSLFQPEWKFRLAHMDRADSHIIYFTDRKTGSGIRDRLYCLPDRPDELVFLSEKRDAGGSGHPFYHSASIDFRPDHSGCKKNNTKIETLVFGICLPGTFYSL